MGTILRASAVLICLASSAGEELRFSATAGTEVTREWNRESRRTLARVTVSTGDESQSAEPPEVTLLSKAKLLVSDSFAKVEGDRPVRIVRTYDAIEKSAQETTKTKDGERENTLKEICDLVGRPLVFEWDEARESYKCSFEKDSETESDTPLDALVADMDLQGFLPEKSVSVGDHWSVPFEAVRYGFLRPGGRLEFRDEDGRKHSSRERALSEAAWKALDGECTATLKEIKKDGDERLGVIHVEGKLATSADLDSDDGSMSAGMQHSETFDGELVWDMRAHRARSMAIESKIDFTLRETRQGQKPDGTTVRAKRTLEFTEESTCTYEIREK